MSNKSAPTQRQKAERARRIAMGIARIQRPLKYIRSHSGPLDPVSGESAESVLATRYARYGKGYAVQFIARSLS